MGDEGIEVRVPDAQWRMTADEAHLWELTGAIVTNAKRKVGRDSAFSVMLSRMARELRREVGVEGAKATLQGLIDAMDEAARHDRVG